MDYNNTIYKIGEGRLPMKNTKIEDDDYLLLIYAAIAKGMEYYGAYDEDGVKIVVAAGLPFTRFGEEKLSFGNYLKRGVESFVYEGKTISYQDSRGFIIPTVLCCDGKYFR
jgi:plasmid segregation protein ParM